MPGDLDVVERGLVALEDDLLLGFVVAGGDGAGVPGYADGVDGGFVALEVAWGEWGEGRKGFRTNGDDRKQTNKQTNKQTV